MCITCLVAWLDDGLEDLSKRKRRGDGQAQMTGKGEKREDE